MRTLRQEIRSSLEKGGSVTKFVADEHALLANRLGDLVAAVGSREERLQAFLRNLAHRAFPVDTETRGHQRFLADVAGKNLNGVPVDVPPQNFEQAHDDRIGFFPRRAPWYPDSDGPSSGLPFDDLGQELVAKPVEDVLVTKERRDADEHVLVQRNRFRGIVLEEREVVGQSRLLAQRHPTRKPSLDGARLVFAEVDARFGAKLKQDPSELVDFGGCNRDSCSGAASRRYGCCPMRTRRRASSAGRGHGVDRAPVDRALRHSVEFGRVRLLGESEAVLCLDGLQPLGPIGAGARQDDADGSVALIGRKSLEKEIDRLGAPRGWFDQAEG